MSHKGADKRFHITTDYEFSWCTAFVEEISDSGVTLEIGKL